MSKPVKSRLDYRVIELWARIANPSNWKTATAEYGDLLTPFELKPPMPGYIGKSFFNQDVRIAILGINPGRGRNYAARDKPLLDAVRSLSKAPSSENFKLLMSEYRKHLPKWGIYSDIGFPQRFDMTLSQVMVSNVLPASTDVRGSCRDLDNLYKFTIRRFTSKQLKLLRPDAILIIGTHAKNMLNKYLKGWSSELETMDIWHPTYGLRPENEAEFMGQLDKAGDWIERIRADVG